MDWHKDCKKDPMNDLPSRSLHRRSSECERPISSSSASKVDSRTSNFRAQVPGTPSTNDILASKIRVPTKATKRMKGEIACAECRRLKIRCDRTIPCSTCVKRGCTSLCPNGTLPPGDGSRFVLAANDHLQRKITRLEARMRSLEDALAIIHTTTPDSIDVLLSNAEDIDDDDEPVLKPVAEEYSEPSSLASALGTLWLDGQGETRFFGPSGGSESLLLKSKNIEDSTPSIATHPPLQELDPSYLPAEINHCYQSFPFTPPGITTSSIQAVIHSFLPPVDHAISLCDTFLEHLSWMFNIVSRHQFVNELVPVIYRRKNIPYGPHDLALLLIVLGIGSLVDLNLPPYNLQAQHYYRLARAALALQPVLAEQSVVTIKVLHLMSIYNGMSGKESNLEQSYVLLDLAVQVALRIGFHVDPSMWGFCGREAYDRRVYFWNLMAGVLWQSLVTGRPPGLLTSFIDCRIPTAEDENLYQQGEVPLGFGIWGFRASSECLIPLTKTTLATKPPNYSVILELDKKIRNFSLPRSSTPQGQDDRTAVSMQTFVRSHYQDLMMLFLHRGYFAQAMSDYPENPLACKYGHSVQGAYSSACVILQDTKAQFMKKPLLCARVWRIWSIAFSAAVIVGTVAIHGQHMHLSPPAFEEFADACLVFRSAGEVSSRAARALPILQTMLQRAMQARDAQKLGDPKLLGAQQDDDLSLFGGKTRVLNPLSTGGPTIQKPPVVASQHPSPGADMHIHANVPRHHPSMTQPGHELPFSSKRNSTQFVVSPIVNEPFNQPQQNPSHIRSQPQRMTFADLSGGWDGLFHEVPSPTFGNAVQNQHSLGEGAMLNDRWSSFMHNYGILGETPGGNSCIL